MKNAWGTILFIVACIGLGLLWYFVSGKPEVPTETAPIEVSESGEPMSAAAAMPDAKKITTYVAYQVIRGAGAMKTIGALRVESGAWRKIYVIEGEEPDYTVFIRDVIAALEEDGVLDGLDLTKTKSNWVTVLSPGANPPLKWVLDSRDIPERPRE